MTIRNFDALFTPGSIALLGASDRPGSVGAVIARNLASAGYAGDLWFVNPRPQMVEGRQVLPSVETLPASPDLAVIATPAEEIPALITALGKKGCRAAVVISAAPREQADSWRSAVLTAAQPHLLRVLGPNCIGFQSPAAHINASFAHLLPKPGRIALVSQSGAVLAAMLDWAASADIGFSHVLSLGDMADIDFGDVLDFLALDSATNAVLLYMENVTHARKFMSAARIAARAKPVIVVKAGRSASGARAAATHTGALAGADRVYDAAFSRAGMLRVDELEHLFLAAELLAHTRKINGDRLSIITNGGGAGVMAADVLEAEHGVLASLPDAVIRKLDAALPPNWSRANPVDIIGDAREDRYQAAVEALLDEGVQDGLLVINCPTGVADRTLSAEAVIGASARTKTPVLTCWLGEQTASDARKLFRKARLPTFATPNEAVRGFMHLANYSRNQRLLMETPHAAWASGDRDAAYTLVERVKAEVRSILTEPESKALLSAYGIPTVRTLLADTPEAAGLRASELGGSIALKILSPDLTHKSDIGGVRLGLSDPAAVTSAAHDMLAKVRNSAPSARIDGFTVQQMIYRPSALELIVGFSADRTFGPVVLFGAGGVAVETLDDTAIAIPPLNDLLARELIARTRVAKLLRGYRHVPAADTGAIVNVLLGLSRIIADLPMITSMDINPLLVDRDGVLALDARVQIGATPSAPMSICPYPSAMEQEITLQEGQRFVLPPIKPDDQDALIELIGRCAPRDLRFRFLGSLASLPPALAARLSQIDYDREMALVAIEPDTGAIAGVCRIIIDPNFERANMPYWFAQI